MPQKIDKFLILPILLFSILMLPFLSSIPYLDGNIDFVQTYDFYTGGFSQYFNQHSGSIHPPFKLFLAEIFFRLGGLNRYSYNLIGLVFGIVGIIAIYHLSQKLFNKQTARINALLLATSPMFLAVSIFSLRDFLLTVLILSSLCFYLEKKYFCYAAVAVCVVLTKETGLLLPISVLIVELCYLVRNVVERKNTRLQNLIFGQYPRLQSGVKNEKRIPKEDTPLVATGGLKPPVARPRFTFLLAPLLATLFWRLFLKSNNQKPWGDWIFAETASKGSLYTIANNLVTLDFLNKYAYQNWQQLFFLNFNWVYWLLAFVGVVVFLCSPINRRRIVEGCVSGTARAKTLLVSGLFGGGYFLSVLSFQTYTIPRYALPLFPLLLLTTAWAVGFLGKKSPPVKVVLVVFLSVIISSSLLFSVDPISTKLWGKMEVLGEEIYNLPGHLAGNDGITYNLQYLLIAKRRMERIMEAERGEGVVVSNDCRWIFPDPVNERRTVKILGLDNLGSNLSCQPLIER